MPTRAVARVLLIASIFACALLPGCGGAERDTSTLYRHLSQNPTTLDPAQVKDVPGGRIIACVYGTLLTYDAEGKLVGDVAESYTVSPDGKTYTFRIRPALKFADGREVTASDVVRSFKRTLSPATKSPRTWVLDRILGARDFLDGKINDVPGLRIGDDGSLVIELETPFAPFTGLLTMPAAAVIPEGLTDFTSAGYGSGPFRISAFRPNEQFVLEANPQFRGPGPHVKRVVFKIIGPPVAMLAEFKQGQIDVMEVPGDYVESLQADPATRDLIERVDSANVYFLGINCASPRFANPEVRRALASALDVKYLVDNLRPGRATVAKGPIPPGIPGYDPDVKAIAFDAPGAKRRLTELGFDLSQPVRFLHGSDEDTVRTCQAIAGELEKAGLKIDRQARERGTFKQMLSAGDFDLYYYSWWADYFDAENFLAPLFLARADRSGGNPTGYSNPQVDALIREAQAEVDAAKRSQFYAKIQTLILPDAPRIWLWHAQELTIRQPWVKGLVLSPIYNADKGNTIRIERPTDR